MTKDQTHHRTHLFTLRLWPETKGDDQVEWRGKVQHVLSGEARYFRRWSELRAFVRECLPAWEMEKGERNEGNRRTKNM